MIYLMWRNLMRKPIRTSLTVASVFVAFMLFGTLIAVRTALGGGVELAGGVAVEGRVARAADAGEGPPLKRELLAALAVWRGQQLSPR